MDPDFKTPVGDGVLKPGLLSAQVETPPIDFSEPGFDAFAAFGPFDIGQLEEPGQESGIGRATEKKRFASLHHQRHYQLELLTLPRRCRLRVPLGCGPAGTTFRQRAQQAKGLPRPAEGGTNLHQRLIGVARPQLIQQLAGGAEQTGAYLPAFRVLFEGQPAAEHPLDIAIEHRHLFAESLRGDGRGRIGSNTRQLLPFRRRAWQLGQGDKYLGRRVQLTGPAVITQTRPARQHLVDFSRRQRRQARKRSQESPIVGNHGLHLRLLQHHLRDPYPVRVPVLPPGQVPLLAIKVAQQSSLQRLRRHPGCTFLC